LFKKFKNSKNYQKIVKKNVKVVKKLSKFKTSGEDDDDDEEEEEDWWLLDQVSTSSHLEKTNKTNGAIVEKVRWCNSNTNSKRPEKMMMKKKKIGGS
jgi:hypothetical protein